LLGFYGYCDVSTYFLFLRQELLPGRVIYRGAYSTFDRRFDLSEARRIGFTESVDHVQGYYIAFNRMREGKVIP
jgi:hypothetical protein